MKTRFGGWLIITGLLALLNSLLVMWVVAAPYGGGWGPVPATAWGQETPGWILLGLGCGLLVAGCLLLTAKADKQR